MTTALEQLTALIDEGADARTLTEAVRQADDKELKELMSGAHRERFLDLIFERMPDQFRPENSEGIDAVVHWYVRDRPDGAEDGYQVVIADKTCTTGKALDRQPRATMRVRAVPFLRLMAEQANPMRLLATNKLKVSGDLMFAAKTQELFADPGS